MNYLNCYVTPFKSDILNAVRHHRGLHAKFDKFCFNDGAQKDLLFLSGTIPVPYKWVPRGPAWSQGAPNGRIGVPNYCSCPSAKLMTGTSCLMVFQKVFHDPLGSRNPNLRNPNLRIFVHFNCLVSQGRPVQHPHLHLGVGHAPLPRAARLRLPHTRHAGSHIIIMSLNLKGPS